MLRLENIKESNSIVTCDFYPEDCTQPGRLVLDVLKGEVVEVNYPEGYEDTKYYIYKALWWAQRAVNNNELPDKKRIVWY